MSRTVTVKVAVLLFPASSVAVTVTVVTPNGNVLPDAGLALTVGVASTASVAVGRLKVTTAPLALVASAVRLLTAPSTGGVVSKGGGGGGNVPPPLSRKDWVVSSRNLPPAAPPPSQMMKLSSCGPAPLS